MYTSQATQVQVLGYSPKRRLGWACALCPSQVRAAQVTRYLAHALTPRWAVCLIASPVPAAQFSEWLQAHPSQMCYVSLLGS